MKNNHRCPEIGDYGPEPLVVDLDRSAEMNPNFRTALWTGSHLQVTLMTLPPGEDIGVELHKNTDQFIRIEQGCGMVQFGRIKNSVRNIQHVNCHSAVIIPAGTWHNIINCGNVPLRLYSIYAPPHHPFGTIHRTKEAAEQEH